MAYICCYSQRFCTSRCVPNPCIHVNYCIMCLFVALIIFCHLSSGHAISLGHRCAGMATDVAFSGIVHSVQLLFRVSRYVSLKMVAQMLCYARYHTAQGDGQYWHSTDHGWVMWFWHKSHPRHAQKRRVTQIFIKPWAQVMNHLDLRWRFTDKTIGSSLGIYYPLEISRGHSYYYSIIEGLTLVVVSHSIFIL